MCRPAPNVPAYVPLAGPVECPIASSILYSFYFILYTLYTFLHARLSIAQWFTSVMPFGLTSSAHSDAPFVHFSMSLDRHSARRCPIGSPLLESAPPPQQLGIARATVASGGREVTSAAIPSQLTIDHAVHRISLLSLLLRRRPPAPADVRPPPLPVYTSRPAQQSQEDHGYPSSAPSGIQ